jgi:hypothetical protein
MVPLYNMRLRKGFQKEFLLQSKPLPEASIPIEIQSEPKSDLSFGTVRCKFEGRKEFSNSIPEEAKTHRL